MSGHSKWNNIKHKKEKSDAAKAKIFTKIGKEMSVAIKAGGPDPTVNSKLRDLIAKAKANNVPNENIQRTIKKFSESNDVTYEEITYEGYGPSGVAVIVEASTDNRNRTAGNVRAWFNKYGGNMGQNGCVGYLFEEKGVITIIDEDEEITYEGYGPSGVAIIVETSTDNRNRTAGNVRAAFNKYGGNLGQNGCVGFLFEEKGVITIVDEDEELDEDKVMEDALECGAEDIKCDEGEYTIYTSVDDFADVREAVIALGYQLATADLAKVPTTYVDLDNEDDIANMEKMLDKFNEDDDVNAVYHNWNA